MVKYDVLEVYNNLGEFNVDDYSRKLARDSLQLDSFALQFENDVNIDGGNIIVDSLYIRTDMMSNLFLTNSNNTNNITFSNIYLPQWVYSNIQKNIYISRFSNDIIYMNNDTFDYDIKRYNFIFDDSLLKLKFRPSFQAIASDYGYTSGFLVSSSNFEDIIDKTSALTNIGINSMGEQKSKLAVFQKLNILSNLNLQIDNESDRFVVINENLVSFLQYPFPILLDKLSNNDGSLHLPTNKLVYDTFSNISNIVNVQGVQNIDFIKINKELILSNLSDESVLTSNYFLDNITTDEIKQSLENLSIGNISLQNSNIVHFDHITFSNIQSKANTVFFQNKLMNYVDFLKNTKEPGFLILNESVPFLEFSNIRMAFSNTIHTIYTEIRSNFDDFSNDMFKSNDNLSINDNLFDINTNLGLHDFALGGRLVDLENRPTYLSELNNDTNYISKYNKLSDLTNFDEAIENLGISNMAFNSRNIGGTNLKRSKLLGSMPEIDYLVLNEGMLRLESTTSSLDFLYLISKDTGKGYSYKTLNNADETYMSSTYFTNVDDGVLVKLNDIYNMTTIEKNNVLSRIRVDDPYKTAPIINTTNIPTAEFTYKRINEMTSNILTKFSIPFEYYDGWL